jgi:hypothetical protein
MNEIQLLWSVLGNHSRNHAECHIVPSVQAYYVNIEMVLPTRFSPGPHPVQFVHKQYPSTSSYLLMVRNGIKQQRRLRSQKAAVRPHFN